MEYDGDLSRRSAASITTPGLLLGIGFGGLFDGVVLHQILRWHHMLSSEACCPVTTVRGLELNTLADGLFHLTTILVLAVGTAMLWSRIRDRGAPWSGWRLVGLGLEGWGGFNVIEGLVDHHLLGIHHVRPGPQRSEYDIGFLIVGAILAVVGHLLASRGAAGVDPGTE